MSCQIRVIRNCAGILGAIVAASACAAPTPPRKIGNTASSIVGDGTTANDYPWVVFMTRNDGSGASFDGCSGALIAPQVVLTAGHCVDGVTETGNANTGWTVTAPYAGDQQSEAKNGDTFDYKGNPGRSLNPDQNDVGLVFLDKPIQLDSYPRVADAPVPDGTEAFNIGRVDNGELSRTDLFIGPTIEVQNGGDAYPSSYTAADHVQPGDSGGPVVAMVNGEPTIIAVNSASGGNTEYSSAVLARVDQPYLQDWMDVKVSENGGPGPDNGGTDDPNGDQGGSAQDGAGDPNGDTVGENGNTDNNSGDNGNAENNGGGNAENNGGENGTAGNTTGDNGTADNTTGDDSAGDHGTAGDDSGDNGTADNDSGDQSAANDGSDNTTDDNTELGLRHRAHHVAERFARGHRRGHAHVRVHLHCIHHRGAHRRVTQSRPRPNGAVTR